VCFFFFFFFFLLYDSFIELKWCVQKKHLLVASRSTDSSLSTAAVNDAYVTSTTVSIMVARRSSSTVVVAGTRSIIGICIGEAISTITNLIANSTGSSACSDSSSTEAVPSVSSASGFRDIVVGPSARSFAQGSAAFSVGISTSTFSSRGTRN